MRNKKYIIVCLILVVCMLIPLVSCEKGEMSDSKETSCDTQDGVVTESESETTEAITENPDEIIKIDDLEKYSVVYDFDSPFNLGKEALLIARAVRVDFKKIINLSSNDGEASEYEILIGNTGRKESTDFISTLGAYGYGYTVINKKIVIAGKTGATTKKAAELFLENAFGENNTDEKIWLRVSDSVVENPDISKIKDRLTVMSFNVQYWDQSEERHIGVLEQIKSYMPDVIGFQEADGPWMRVLEKGLESSGYAFAGVGITNDSESQHNPIFYRKDKFELVSSATKWLSETHDSSSKLEVAGGIRIVTYVVLSRKSDGMKFIHANTHLDHLSEVAREGQAVQLLNVLRELPNYPVILTGDFNAAAHEKAYGLVTGSGFSNVADIAATSDGADHITYHGYGEEPPEIIDFCFVEQKDFLASKYRVCDEATPADHYAIYCELIPW